MSRPRPMRSSPTGLPPRSESTCANARPIGLGDVAVDLVAVQAADVVGLEDLRWSGGCHEAADRRDPGIGAGVSRRGRAARRGRRARSTPAVLDRAVERELAAEAGADVAQHVDVLDERVGMERRHDAARAQRVQPDDDVADPQAPAFPVALGEPLDAAEDDVRPQPAAVAAEAADRAVGGDEEGEDVEAGGRVEDRELRVGTGDVLHDGGDLRRGGGAVLDERLAVGESVARRPSSRGRVRDVTMPCGPLTTTRRSPAIPSRLISAGSSASPAIDLTG